MFCSLLSFLRSVASVFCEIDSELNIEKLKSNLPEGVELPDSLKNVTLPSADDVRRVIKDKCKKTSGGDEAFDHAEEAQSKLLECITGLINVEQLQKDIEDAQPRGELDTVFNGYVPPRLPC